MNCRARDAPGSAFFKDIRILIVVIEKVADGARLKPV